MSFCLPYAAGRPSIHSAERRCIEQASAIVPRLAPQPTEQRAEVAYRLMNRGGWGTHMRNVRLRKTAPSLFERTGGIQTPCMQSVMEYPLGRPAPRGPGKSA